MALLFTGGGSSRDSRQSRAGAEGRGYVSLL
jgi:hypothetical protein